MYETLVGKQRALVFPIMCNAFLRLDYSDNVVDTNDNSDSSDDVGYGLWAHDDSFTFEAIITPYDINGYGTKAGLTAKRSITASKKIMPALAQSVYSASNQNNYQSERFLKRSDRARHEMRIFHSDNFKLSLRQKSSHNENSPAEYSIKVELTVDGTTETFESDAVILPEYLEQYTYSNNNEVDGTGSGIQTIRNFNSEGYRRYRQIRATNGTIATTTGSTTTSTVNVNSVSNFFFVGQKVYFKTSTSSTDFDFEGFTISAVDSGANTITLDSTPVAEIPNNTVIYTDNYAEPTYIQKEHHIAVGYNITSGTVEIFHEGKIVFTGNHSKRLNFSFGNSDCFIGANGEGNTGALDTGYDNNQFMGEMHEMSIMKGVKHTYPKRGNLLPTFDRTLLYLRFEEVDA